MQELRVFREAWRISRYTFFDLTNADHATLRAQVDDIYYAALALLLKLMVEFDDDEIVIGQMLCALGIVERDEVAAIETPEVQQLQTQVLAKVQAEQGQGGEDAVVRTRVLTERIPAVLMARVDAASDDEVCRRLGKQAATPQGRPLIRLARMGRSVPEHRSTLWLQWVNLWLYPAVYPGGRDPYTRTALINESAIYAADPFFWRLMDSPQPFEQHLLTQPGFLEALACVGGVLTDTREPSAADAGSVIEDVMQARITRGFAAKSVARKRKQHTHRRGLVRSGVLPGGDLRRFDRSGARDTARRQPDGRRQSAAVPAGTRDAIRRRAEHQQPRAHLMESDDMLRILTRYLSGSPVSESDITEAEQAFARHGGGQRLLQLAKRIGERAAQAEDRPTAQVVDLQRIRIRRQSTNTLAVIEGAAASQAAGWMNVDHRNIKLEIALPEAPDNRIDILIEAADGTSFHLTVLAVHGPNADRCTISIVSAGQTTRFDAALTRRISIATGIHTLDIAFGDAGTVSTELDIA